MRIWGVERRRQEFTEFYTAARDDCLRIVLVSVGDRQLAEDLVAEANLGRLCTPKSALDMGRVLVEANGGMGGPVELRVNPAEMPAGSELAISVFEPSKATGGELRAGWALAKAGSPLDCGPQVTPGSR